MVIQAGISKVFVQSKGTEVLEYRTRSGAKLLMNSSVEGEEHYMYAPKTEVYFLHGDTAIIANTSKLIAGLGAMEVQDCAKLVERLSGKLTEVSASRAGQLTGFLAPNSMCSLSFEKEALLVIQCTHECVVRYGGMVLSGAVEHKVPLFHALDVSIETQDSGAQVAIASYVLHRDDEGCNGNS